MEKAKHRSISLRNEDGSPKGWRECACRRKGDHDAPKRRGRVKIGTGSPGSLLLDQWGLMLAHAFGETAYQVGSSVCGKKWRDVDVRVILDDEQFDALFGAPFDKRHHGCTDPFWSAMMTAFSLWGQKVTGLPIDFQVQRRSDVPESDWDKFRQPLGTYASNHPKPAWKKER